jgi:hypothetical protein
MQSTPHIVKTSTQKYKLQSVGLKLVVISPMLSTDYLAHFSDVSQVQMSTPHQKRFSVMKRCPFPTTIQSRLQQKVDWRFVKHISRYFCHIKEQYWEQ